jgi:antitoxin ParD1/3/4
MNISISLTPELLGLVRAKLESGRYSSTSEVVREALRLLERVDQWEADHSEALRRAWREGVDSGDAGPFDFAELRATARRELAASKASRKN